MSDVDPLTASALREVYAIERELGRGGMAIVYLAQDLRHHRRVAIKVLRRELASTIGPTRFLQEIQLAASLTHPHILPLLDSGTVREDGEAERPYYVMPYIEGESLRDRLRRETQLPVEEAVRLAREVADALEHAHAHGVIHRDIKPENILLSGGHAVVADFGVALALDAAGAARLTSTGILLGTPQYMSPEQATGERSLDARADVYALGCVLYEMLSGEPPFTGANAQVVLARQLTGELPSLRTARPAVPAVLDRVVTRALARNRADRYATAAELSAALGPLPATPSRVALWPRVALAGALVLATVLVVLWVVRRPADVTLDADAIAVAPFEVLHRHPDLALWREGMVDVLSRNLDGAGPLRATAPTAVIRRWSGRADRESAVRLGRSLGARLVVFGSMVEAGRDSVRLTAALVDATTGVVADNFERRGTADRADLLADSLTLDVLGYVGRSRGIEHLSTGTRSRAPLPALKAFLQGEQFLRRAAWDSAFVSYERAIALDSTFAFALYRAGIVLAWIRLSEDSVAGAYRLRAARLNHGLAPRDSLLIAVDSVSSALYAQAGPAFGLRRQMIDALQAAIRRSPGDPELWNALGEEGFHHGLDGGMSKEEVLEALDHAIELDSSFAPSYVHAITLAFETRGHEDGLRYARAFLARAPSGFQAEGIRLALRLMDPREAASDSVQAELKRIDPQGLFEAWAAAQYAADDGESAIVVARELASRSAVSAPRLAAVNDRLSLLYDALLVRGHIREAAPMAHVVDPASLAPVAQTGAVVAEAADRQFRAWLDQASPLAVHGLEWWAFRRDTLAISTFGRLCSRSGSALAPCFGPFGAAAATAYLALARADSAAALDAFLALPDTLCRCILHRLTLVRLLHRAGRFDEAAARLRLPIGGLLYGTGVHAMLWRMERAQNAERRGNAVQAARDYQHGLDHWSRADPELSAWVQQARDGHRRVTAAR